MFTDFTAAIKEAHTRANEDGAVYFVIRSGDKYQVHFQGELSYQQMTEALFRAFPIENEPKEVE